ncbi:Cuticle protein 10.9 [Nymphon striatum]|nr:Cuticle protein 10.9 [Nymphon striatum]
MFLGQNVPGTKFSQDKMFLGQNGPRTICSLDPVRKEVEKSQQPFGVLATYLILMNIEWSGSTNKGDWTDAECLNHQKSEQEPTNMLKFAALCLLVVSVYGSRSYDHPRQGYGYGYAPKVETYEKPQPFEFAYEIVDDYYNTQARQESGDEYGNVKGSYSQKNAEGLERVVEYVADEGGFRAIVKTNEPGTDNQNSADVEITANPIVVKEAPKKGYAAPAHGHRAYAAPSYGYRAYAAPAYGHRAHGYGAPAYGQTHGYGNYERNYGRTHSYQAQKPHGIKATGHASTTYSAGYGKDGYSHSVAKTFVLCLLAVSAYGFGYGYQPREVRVVKVEKIAEPVNRPEPYEFSYSITDEDSNTQSRQESGDANGHMKGGYRITLANGISRWVQYVANGDGFTATVETNEPGTDSQSPADVIMNANPIEIKEAPKKIVKKIVVEQPSYGYPRYY